jgi:hypothetical protein
MACRLALLDITVPVKDYNALLLFIYYLRLGKHSVAGVTNRSHIQRIVKIPVEISTGLTIVK